MIALIVDEKVGWSTQARTHNLRLQSQAPKLLPSDALLS